MFFLFGFNLCLLFSVSPFSSGSLSVLGLFVLSHILEISPFLEVGMKRLLGRPAGGLRGRRNSRCVSERRWKDVSVPKRGPTAKGGSAQCGGNRSV